MKTTVLEIPISNLLVSLIPIIFTVLIFFRWSLKWKNLLYATLRMLSQLLLIGFVLTYVFEKKNALHLIVIISFMLAVASWIALNPVEEKSRNLLLKVFIALMVGCFSVLAIVIFGVIRSPDWHDPVYLIPLAGMVLSNSMSILSLCAERFFTEIKRGVIYEEARRVALQVSLIPTINSFFAVGLVSLPGMMTGQILAGIDPMIAVRYQVVLMGMVLGGNGLSAALFLRMMKNHSSS